MKPPQELYRIIDANFNRSKEGLRVCEDVARYIWNKKSLTKDLKDLRHELTGVLMKCGIHKLLKSRDVLSDTGRPSSPSEFNRSDVEAVYTANIQRVKEALRVLEEIFKLIDQDSSERLKTLRYRTYVLEQNSFKKS